MRVRSKVQILLRPPFFRSSSRSNKEKKTMFTIKLYPKNNFRQRILEADSFTILRNSPSTNTIHAEITLHRNNGDDCRYDIGDDIEREVGAPDVYQKAIIENSSGKTTEIVSTPGPH
jgi:hypothetical protein